MKLTSCCRIPVIGATILFFILHRRLVRKRREEDRNDHASLDFGLGDVPQPGNKRKGPVNTAEMQMNEKGGRARQMSMDMGVNSPYLLPPELQNSRESLHSLSRTIHSNEDPYRPVTQYFPSDGASMRSQSKTRDGSSIYTGSSKAPSRMHEMGTAELLQNAGGMPRSNPPVGGFVPPPRQNSLPQKNASPVDSVASESAFPPPPYPVEPPQVHLPEPVQAGIQRKGLPTNPRPGQNLAPTSAPYPDTRDSFVSNDGAGLRASNNYLGAFINSRDPSPTPPSLPSEAPEGEVPQPKSNRKSPPPAINTLPTNPRPARNESIPAVQEPQTFMDDESEYGDGFKITPPSPGRENNAEFTRGQRFSMDVPPEEFAQAGLGAPGFDPRRLSMGFRPLPPDAITESDDPELRANRIRSFYKEYFDESKPAPEGQYYEDYDENYLGDAAYYDHQQNNFVMPYAQPVTRRAMTPPARGPRFQGPPRTRNGSMGPMSAGGMLPPGPRAFSSASGRMARPGPRRQLPPPVDLNSLPTPSKLKDDSFALFNSIEFAPPQTYRDRQAGRSESPFGERRPYSPAVPAFAPVVSAFEELAPIPSPYVLPQNSIILDTDLS